MFYDERIAESRFDHLYLADGMGQDAFNAMLLLKELGFLTPTDENKTIGEHLASYPVVTVYLHHIAVKEDYRRGGIAGWPLRNLPRILHCNYSVFPRQVITFVYPEEIRWSEGAPIFSSPPDESCSDGEMLKIMARMFESNGYERHGVTRYYIVRENI